MASHVLPHHLEPTVKSQICEGGPGRPPLVGGRPIYIYLAPKIRWLLEEGKLIKIWKCRGRSFACYLCTLGSLASCDINRPMEVSLEVSQGLVFGWVGKSSPDLIYDNVEGVFKWCRKP